MLDCTWLPWLTMNRNHNWERGPLFACYGTGLLGMQVREQGGFGIIDVAVCAREPGGGDQDWLPWLTRNEDHDWERSPFVAPDDYVLVGLEVREQGGFGIVDARCLFRRAPGPPDVREGPWFCANPDGDIRRSVCPAGRAITGIQLREQGGFGVIDVRLAHTDLARF